MDFHLLDLSAKDYYSIRSQRRTYHNWQHAEDVKNAILHLNSKAGRSLLLAALWHDAIYIPGAGGSLNEDASAAALIFEFKSMHTKNAFSKYDNSWFRPARGKKFEELHIDVLRAASLIKKSSVACHLSPYFSFASDIDVVDHDDLKYLLDADLRSLALPYPEFLQKQKDIIAENFGDPEKDLQKSAVFLRQFSELPAR